MSRWRVTFAALLFFTLQCVEADPAKIQDPQSAMRADVAKLVEAAGKRTTLWPWKGPEPEVAHVAKYGKQIAPLLVAQLAEDPDAMEPSSAQINWNVQQQIALVLCRIYGVTEEEGHIYMSRAPRERNASVKQFWLRKIVEQ